MAEGRLQVARRLLQQMNSRKNSKMLFLMATTMMLESIQFFQPLPTLSFLSFSAAQSRPSRGDSFPGGQLPEEKHIVKSTVSELFPTSGVASIHLR